jgi:GTP cyclohydrolase I
MDRKKIEQGVRLILEGIGEDVTRPGLQKTPQRVAEMLEEILAGYAQNPTIQPDISEPMENNVVEIRDISFYSMCEHHLLPFFGKVHIAYIPEGNRVAGFSAFARLVNTFAQRLQIQERMTNQIADAIMEQLKPQGVLVVVEAQQLCVSMRGPKQTEVRTRTRALRGEFSAQIQSLVESSLT